MYKDIKFDLKEFQREVIKDYESFRKGFEDNSKFSKQGYSEFQIEPDLGIIRRNIVKLSIFFRAFFRDAYVNSQPFIERRKKAVEIIENPKIKNILCPVFKRRISSDFFDEELEIEVILILTELLCIKETAGKFSIEKEVNLFSMLTHEILQKGIEHYCLD